VDPRNYGQLRGFWPDVAGPFAEVTPAGCALVRMEDEWKAGRGSKRRRAIELIREPNAPDIEELSEEATEDAMREGWTALHEDGEPARLELENVVLSITATESTLLVGAAEVLRLQFDQPWPADAGAPIETSEVFQRLVRHDLRIGAEPDWLLKEVVFDRFNLSKSDIIREAVQMACPENLLPRFDVLGFLPPNETGGDWRINTSTEVYEVVSTVKKSNDRVHIQMLKTRHVS